jgi:hypothetical protein
VGHPEVLVGWKEFGDVFVDGLTSAATLTRPSRARTGHPSVWVGLEWLPAERNSIPNTLQNLSSTLTSRRRAVIWGWSGVIRNWSGRYAAALRRRYVRSPS